MKRYILLTLTMLVLHTGPLFAQSAQPREKSEVEVYMQQVAKGTKSSEIDYAYISTSMFKQLLSQLLSVVNEEAKAEIGLDKIFGSAMYMRRFISTGEEGYRMLSTMMRPFLVGEEESCMGMELCALNRKDGVVSIIYGNAQNVLVINDYADADNLTVVFIAGLSYEAFMKMDGSGIDLGF
ncbi:MAG: hypothetical protein IJA98_01390 [Bacteroidaceae bacterium]|nr:hypothetical protein [Bacteroidaceae bacterium]MBQ7966991.1 hypothetical protein [Bacteroidaceae bacterium]